MTKSRYSQPQSVLKRLVINAGLIFCGLLAALICLEAALHFTSYKYLLTRDRHLRNYYQFDPVKGFDIKPNVKNIPISVDNRIEYHIWSNELGCFDNPYHGEHQFILLVGDSFTHSFAPFEHKWGTQIEKLLDYRVLKCGVTGYGTYQELEKAREVIKKVKAKPQLIIVGYFWNDLSDDFAFPGLTVVDGFLVNSFKFKDRKTNKLVSDKLARHWSWWDKVVRPDYPLSVGEQMSYYLDQHLIVMNLLNDAVTRLMRNQKIDYSSSTKFMAFKPEAANWKLWEKHLQNLSGFKDLAAANQASLLVVLIPTSLQVYPFLAPHQNIDLERPNRVLTKLLKDQGIEYLDLLPLMRCYADLTPRSNLDSGKDLYWQHNSHWSIKGENLAGLLVSRYILQHNFIPVLNREARLENIAARLNIFNKSKFTSIPRRSLPDI